MKYDFLRAFTFVVKVNDAISGDGFDHLQKFTFHSKGAARCGFRLNPGYFKQMDHTFARALQI